MFSVLLILAIGVDLDVPEFVANDFKDAVATIKAGTTINRAKLTEQALKLMQQKLKGKEAEFRIEVKNVEDTDDKGVYAIYGKVSSIAKPTIDGGFFPIRWPITAKKSFVESLDTGSTLIVRGEPSVVLRFPATPIVSHVSVYETGQIKLIILKPRFSKE